MMGSWGYTRIRQEGKTKPGSRQITVEGYNEPLLQMCVAPESAFPTRVFSLSGKTPHILCCVYEKESIGKEHFRKHSDLSRFLDNVAVITFILRFSCFTHLSSRSWGRGEQCLCVFV